MTSPVSAIITFSSFVFRTHNKRHYSGLRRIINSSNSLYAIGFETHRCFHSFRRAPNSSSRMSSNLVMSKQIIPDPKSYQSVVRHLHNRLKPLFSSSASAVEDGKAHSLTGPLTKLQAQDLIMRLTEEERTALLTALQEFQSEKRKAEYEGQLAGQRWRSRFGRPSKLPSLGDVDPTGAYCPVPEDWLAHKYAETVPPPSTKELWNVAVHNALPFVGFGFLDNFVMIIAGDQIELMLGSVMVLSTMAAAALGNTISDIMGIGSAWYVERLTSRVGMKPPKLSPIQLDMSVSRQAANMGRVLGVTVGCLLGMFPLLFLTHKSADDSQEKEEVT